MAGNTSKVLIPSYIFTEWNGTTALRELTN